MYQGTAIGVLTDGKDSNAYVQILNHDVHVPGLDKWDIAFPPFPPIIRKFTSSFVTISYGARYELWKITYSLLISQKPPSSSIRFPSRPRRLLLPLLFLPFPGPLLSIRITGMVLDTFLRGKGESLFQAVRCASSCKVRCLAEVSSNGLLVGWDREWSYKGRGLVSNRNSGGFFVLLISLSLVIDWQRKDDYLTMKTQSLMWAVLPGLVSFANAKKIVRSQISPSCSNISLTINLFNTREPKPNALLSTARRSVPGRL